MVRPRVQYFTAATIDGFIADADNSLDWLFAVPHSEDDGAWDGFIGGVGVLVMGATTYEWMLAHDPKLRTGPERWREYYGDRPCRVFSHREQAPIPSIDFGVVSGSVAAVFEEVAALADGGTVWVLGGGDLVGQFDDAGLLDEIHVHLTPVVLGAGAPLLPRRITSERLRFRDVQWAGQRINAILDVTPPEAGKG